MDLTDPKEFKRSVERRSRIQYLLLELYSYGRDHLNRRVSSRVLAFQMLSAVAFSLWRAAFLPGGERTWNKIESDAMKFLEVLIRDNAITFAQDRETRGWTFGYYLNSAYLRLAYLDKELLTLPSAHSTRINKFLKTQITKQKVEPNSYIAWDHAYEAATEAFRKLSGNRRSELTKRVPNEGAA